MTTKALKYYNFRAVLSRNAVYNFIIGARGLGKTYGAKKKAINDYIRRGDQFIYLRRYHTELKSALPTLFADISHEFPGIHFRVVGQELQMRRGEKKTDKWEIMGYGIALSKAQQKKSVAFPRVKTIIFDEFIIERGAVHYLPEEAKAFNDFYSTVDRWKDKTRVLFLANSISIMNPYFIEYDIRPKENQEWITLGDGFLCAHFAPSEEFSTGVYKTRFGQFIAGTEYADYSVGSEFSDNNESLIGRKTEKHKYYCTLETKTGTFSIWIDYSGPFFFIQEKRPKQELVWTMLPEKMAEGKSLVSYTDKMVQSLRSGFSRGRVTFSSPQARNAFVGIYKR
jgi:hypothetical protein